MTFEEIHQKLAEAFGEAVGDIQPATDPFVVVKADRLLDVMEWLKTTPGVEMNFLQDETAVDYPDDAVIRMVYHLFSYGHRHGFKLKVELDREAPRIPSVQGLWPVANWYEREIHDLFGVAFDDHPDLRPLMLPDDWEGHPLRKDYEEPQGYHGISHFRFSPLEGYARLDEIRREAAEAEAAAAAPEAAEPTEA